MKIFCIGLSRTGTSSLTKALGIMGYKSIHFPKKILNLKDQRLIIKFDKILDDYDAFSDTPIVRFYKELDVKYPGAKFILTVREIDAWLKSCERYFSFRSKGDIYNKSLRLDLYGTAEFSKEKFKESYYKHLDEVLKYFKNRKQDLCIINICDGEGWEKLCSFLGRSFPDVPFPRKNYIPTHNSIKKVIKERLLQKFNKFTTFKKII